MKKKLPQIVIDYFLTNGKKYTPSLCPDGVIRGNPGKCFDLSALNACRDIKYKYVEGIAKPADHWILHAWLTDSDGRKAYDPTWLAFSEGKEIAPPWKLIGIEVPIILLANFMINTEYQGVMANAFRDLNNARKIFPGNEAVLLAYKNL